MDTVRASPWAHPAVPAVAVAVTAVGLTLTLTARPTAVPLVAGGRVAFWAVLGTAAGYAVSGSV